MHSCASSESVVVGSVGPKLNVLLRIRSIVRNFESNERDR